MRAIIRYLVLLFLVCLAIVATGLLAQHAARADEPAAPKLILQNTPAGGVTLATDSTRPWKRLLVLPAGEGTWTVIAAEAGESKDTETRRHGDTERSGITASPRLPLSASFSDGGIYLYTVKISQGGAAAIIPDAPVNPVIPPPPPTPSHDLPLDELRAIKPAQTLPVAEREKLAAIYEALAKLVDAGQITSPQQLALATSTQYFATLTQTRLAAWKPWMIDAFTWLDNQQKAGLLTAEKLDRYAIVYRTLAEVLRAKPPAGSPQAGNASRGARR